MDEATYALIPEQLVLREIRFNVFQPGYRVRTLTVVTTLTDPEAFTAEDIAQLYGFRIVELPIPWYFDPHSKLSLVKDSIQMIIDIIQIRLNARRGVYNLSNRLK